MDRGPRTAATPQRCSGSAGAGEPLPSAGARALHPAGRSVLRPAPGVLPVGGAEHGRQPGRVLAAADRAAGAGRPAQRRRCSCARSTTSPRRIQSHFDFEISLERPYKLCDFRPAFGEIFADELAGYDFWGHSDLDVIFGRIRDHLPAAAFEADKILFNGNFSLYRNSRRGGRLVPARGRQGQLPRRHDQPGRHALRRVGRDLLHRRGPRRARLARGRDLRHLVPPVPHPRGGTAGAADPRRYAWEDGEICEYRLERGRPVRRTALLIHLQKRVMRAPARTCSRPTGTGSCRTGSPSRTG